MTGKWHHSDKQVEKDHCRTWCSMRNNPSFRSIPNGFHCLGYCLVNPGLQDQKAILLLNSSACGLAKPLAIGRVNEQTCHRVRKGSRLVGQHNVLSIYKIKTFSTHTSRDNWLSHGSRLENFQPRAAANPQWNHTDCCLCNLRTYV